MLQLSERLYDSLQTDLCLCHSKQLDWPTKIESCFALALIYWTRVRGLVGPFQFPTAKEEIYFFKKVKPRFSSEIEYYNLLYHSELFRPSENEHSFWCREHSRLERFIVNHKEFYHYYKDGCTRNDEDYFLRAISSPTDFSGEKEIDPDSRATTSHDPLVGSLIALERYEVYAARMIDNCNR
jgi:hypothetical protein